MSVSSTKPSLHHCIEQLQQTGHQINDVTHKIESIFNRIFDQLPHNFSLFHKQPWSYSDRENPSQWFYQDTYLSLPIIYTSYPEKTFFLNIQISLYGIGVKSSRVNNTQPLVHIFFSDSILESENTFDIALIHDPRESLISIDNRFFYWSESSTTHYQDWLFSLPLNHLQNSKDILDKLVQPCLTLLSTPIHGSQIPLRNKEIKPFFQYPKTHYYLPKHRFYPE